MKAVMVMFDSLNRHFLPPYGNDWVHAPSFERLAKKAVTFDRSYVCSMPCMPARRDLHTGRPNFLHRSWGPLEPFDDSFVEMLRRQGVSSHMVSDHQHYWEDGGATYHTRYETWQFHRGQEGDAWMGQVADPPLLNVTGRNAATGGAHRQDRINRQFMNREHLQPQAKTFAAGLDFIERNHEADNWFLQIETFDPHEPFFTQRKYQDLYRELLGEPGARPLCDWPAYGRVESQDVAEMRDQLRGHYASLISMCDAHLGTVLDAMDEHRLWEDTMLIVWTDHGFLLGEHEFWAKCQMPFYEEVSHTPFFVWDPRSAKQGERREALVQPSIDLGPTLLEYFGAERTPDMTGRPLVDAIAADQPVREAGIFGMHGGQLNVTDGRYVYMRGPAREDNTPLFNYTVMPTNMRSRFDPKNLAEAELHDGFSFTKGAKVLKMPWRGNWMDRKEYGVLETSLYDLENDPQQSQPIEDEAIERQMREHAVRLMQEADAPPEQYERLGLEAPVSVGR